MRNFNTISGGASLAFVMVVTGCSTTGYGKPITDFRDAVSAGNAVVANHMVEVNSLEREYYFFGRELDGQQPLNFVENGENTPIFGVALSAKGVKARLDTLRLLEIYATRLAALATSDAPERAQKAVITLGQNLVSLSDNLNTTPEAAADSPTPPTTDGEADPESNAWFAVASQVLGNDVSTLIARYNELQQGGASSRPDATIGQYIGPVSQILGVAVKLYLRAKIDATLSAEIQANADNVREVLGLLEADMKYLQDIPRIDLVVMLGEYRLKYNQIAANLVSTRAPEHEAMAIRGALLDKFETLLDRYSLAIAANPTAVIKNIGKAHEALVTYAASGRNRRDFNQLAADLNAAKADIETIVTAVNALRSLRN